MNQNLKKPITIVSILAVAVLTVGVAVAERMELRASEDRFSVGDENLPVIVE